MKPKGNAYVVSDGDDAPSRGHDLKPESGGTGAVPYLMPPHGGMT